MNQNFYNSNSLGFDQTQPPQFPVIHPPPQETSIKILHDQENVINAVKTFLRKFNRISFFETPKVLLLAWDRVFEIKDALGNKQYKPKDIKALFGKLLDDLQNIHEELADMGDEHLDTISTTESDEFIKPSVENLVPNPSESEGENECDVPAGFTTFSNVLFDAEYDFDSSNDQSFSDEDLPEKIYSNPLFDEEIIPMKIDPHSFNIDSFFDEFAGELTLLKSITLGIDETDCHPEEKTHFTKRLLYDNSSPRPPEEFVSENSNADIESFSPSPIPIKDSDSHMEEIDLSFNPDDPMPLGIEEDDDDSERDIPILEKLLDNYSLSLLEIESFHFDIPSSYRPPAKPPDGNTGILNIKMMGDISDQKVPIPNLMITRVSSQEKSPDLLPHQGLEAFQSSAECPMMIHGQNNPILDVLLFHFIPLDQP
nr:hypothetical protein [Tanacetum cinerariifolium]